jgi:hypothetical protein
MSHLYEMYVEIHGLKPEREADIIDGLVAQFPEWAGAITVEENTWDPERRGQKHLEATAQGKLHWGKDTYAFATEVRDEVWKANEAYCQVKLIATDIENAPFDSYDFDEDIYRSEGPGSGLDEEDEAEDKNEDTEDIGA